ncbi:helix-turn-helix domain-containing protein [Paucibacter sp. PLA-PC-4]|uniref:DNA-3-methyladenine glycosylase 2 family protein n=1 Tax=Paucibacter sp. PLA-PC-4 TaxID=2993655 RepID=UPI0022492FBA|nr:Ada metal-binding domain-containing protein [Paucibacter sp. PLA-PC-4]MCX2861609.1 helix-turn-helix domain-containing protein [Paucibacter sp. PLA-PC-4]
MDTTPSLLAADLDPAHCYPALLARDARFDGHWFVGVTSTGIYCRPVCRVRAPKRENCRFYASAAQAEAASFRPCMKCRPELAPAAGGLTWSVMDASRTLARAAARWLDDCCDEQASMEDLAAHLGITSRHLRRIFAAEHGVTPLQYLQTRRLLLAKHLLSDTTLPITEVAHAAGFASLRRFNAAFIEHYRLQPGALRKQTSAADTGDGAAGTLLRLGYRPPYAVDALLGFLAARSVGGVEHVDPLKRRIERTLSLMHRGRLHSGWLSVGFDTQRHQALVSLAPGLWPAVASLLPLLRRWLDLDAEPGRIDEALKPALGEPGAEEMGLRLPGCLDRYELAVRAVLGQQVTVAAARTLAARLVARFGTPLAGAPDERIARLFPSPERMAGAEVAEIAELGIIRRRAETLITLAQAWPGLAYARQQGTVDEVLAELCALPGIGPWTAHYMLMRGWSWPDAFPPGDVVLQKALSPDPERLLSPTACAQAALAFQPYRSYAVLRLWRAAAIKDRKP